MPRTGHNTLNQGSVVLGGWSPVLRYDLFAQGSDTSLLPTLRSEIMRILKVENGKNSVLMDILVWNSVEL